MRHASRSFPPNRFLSWCVLALAALPAVALAQVAAHPNLAAPAKAQGAVTPDARVAWLPFETNGLVVESVTTSGSCVTVQLRVTSQPKHGTLASGAEVTVTEYALRAGYGAGQPSPTQAVLHAAVVCAGGDGGKNPLPGGYPFAGAMSAPCPAVCGHPYPPPQPWHAGETAFPLPAAAVPSAKGLGAVTFRVLAVAVRSNVASSPRAQRFVFDSTNAVTVRY